MWEENVFQLAIWIWAGWCQVSVKWGKWQMKTLNNGLKFIMLYDPKFMKVCFDAVFKINQKKSEE